jgi:hypothetical protein
MDNVLDFGAVDAPIDPEALSHLLQRQDIVGQKDLGLIKGEPQFLLYGRPHVRLTQQVLGAPMIGQKNKWMRTGMPDTSDQRSGDARRSREIGTSNSPRAMPR